MTPGMGRCAEGLSLELGNGASMTRSSVHSAKRRQTIRLKTGSQVDDGRNSRQHQQLLQPLHRRPIDVFSVIFTARHVGDLRPDGMDAAEAEDLMTS